MPAWPSIDSEMTPTRIAVKTLQQDSGSAAADAFNCSSADLCEKSLRRRIGHTLCISKGDWTYVGPEYGQAAICDQPARILFVSMERPKSREPDSFEKTQQSFRHACLKRSNPHMGGTDTILAYLLDRGTPEERRCQQFALTNSVRCSPITGDSRSRSTPRMLAECRRHTEAIIEALRPHIIVTQGANPYDSVAHGLFLQGKQPLFRNDNNRLGRSRRFAEVRRDRGVLILRTAHPARYPDFRWNKGKLPAHLAEAIRDLRERWRHAIARQS